MKRSKMLEILRESFIRNMNSEDVVDDDQMYSNILYDLEDAGMKPPRWDNHNPSQSERSFSRDGDWVRQNNAPDGSTVYSLTSEGWEQE